MSSSLYNLTATYANGNNPNIIGRDNETELLMLTLLRYEKPNALIIGEAGVGKTALIHNLAYLIANDLCPDVLKGFKVVEINTNALLAGEGYRGVFEKKVQTIIDTSLADRKTIFFIDEFHTAEHLGEMANGQTPGLGNTLKPYLTRPDFRVIGATTNQELNKITDKALLRRFFKINVGEPTDEALVHITKSCLNEYGKGLVFQKGTVDKLIALSKTMDGYNPDKVKDLTDFICSYARLKNIKDISTETLTLFFDSYISLNISNKQKDSIIKEDTIIID